MVVTEEGASEGVAGVCVNARCAFVNRLERADEVRVEVLGTEREDGVGVEEVGVEREDGVWVE